MSQFDKVSTDILLELLQVSFHNILYFRKIYPNEIFVKKQKYGSVVHISEHPELNDYINNVLKSIRELLTVDDESIKSIILTFLSKDKIPIEEFVFDLIALRSSVTERDSYFLKTEESLRTICLKLAMAESDLKPLPPDSTFIIEIITYETAHITLNENPNCENFPWIIKENQRIMKNQRLLPLKTVQTQHLTLQLYVRENEEGK